MQAPTNNPWRLAEQDFPYGKSRRAQLTALLRYAILAPSTHNTQPWRFRITNDSIQVYVDTSRALSVIDPVDRELVMSCGTAIFHLRTAIFHYGFEPLVRMFPDLDAPDLVAYVSLGPPREPTLDAHRLFQAITKRHTYRLPFDERPVVAADLAALKRAALTEGADMVVIDDPKEREALADLVEEGERLLLADPAYRRERTTWTHPNRRYTHDGIPPEAGGLGTIESLAAPLLSRIRDEGEIKAARTRRLALEAPLVFILTTPADHAAAWVNAGQALDHVLLRAADAGLAASFLNQPIGVPALRARLADLIGRSGYPQAVLRVGHPEGPLPLTPRRDLGEFKAR